MRSHTHSWPATLLTAVFCSSLWAQAPSIPEEAAAHARREIDANLRMGIAIGLINADGEAFVAYGRADADDSRPLDRRSVFEIGSNSTPVNVLETEPISKQVFGPIGVAILPRLPAPRVTTVRSPFRVTPTDNSPVE